MVHYSRLFGPDDVHPTREPRRTRGARSLVDAAAWAGSDRGAQALLAAGVQQRLARPQDLLAVVTGNVRLPRRAMIRATLDDIAGGRRRCPSWTSSGWSAATGCPSRTGRRRRDSAGRRRWLDAVWEAARVIVEVDGIHHIDATEYWADMDRDNDFTLGGYRVLRFPAFVVRYHGGYVAGKIRAALRGGGRRIEIPA